MEINGIAHIQLTVPDLPAAVAFWRPLLEAMGLHPILETEQIFYCIGGRTGVALSPAAAPHDGDRFVQGRTGLHHVCFRARERADVDAIHALVVQLGGLVVHPPEAAGFAPGYYSVLFEDPAGIRVEVNHVPGRGWLAPG